MTNNPPIYWFFIRGLMREAAHWEDFPSLFEKAFPQIKVVTLDLPGSGTQWSTKSPLTISEMAEKVRNEAKKTLEKAALQYGKRPESYVLSISLGGMVVLEWIQKFSGEFRGAVFINISLAGINPLYKRLKPKAWAPLLDIVFTQDIKSRERKVLNLTASHPKISESQLKMRALAFEKHPVSKVNFFRQLVAASRFRLAKKQIKTPVLLLNSRGDRLVDSSCSEAISKKWNWELQTHPTANHDLPLEDPDWVISKIRDWLQKQ
ncbi:MAG: alpha/beta hydrolase [Proteobacteria bacterium]|nr:alpha/beta hydrolase [Pseudomonadota bacterium]NBY19825.1 alpha/beta hydrolase [bacterium]